MLPKINGDFKKYIQKIQANPALSSLLFSKTPMESIEALSLSFVLKHLKNSGLLKDYFVFMDRKV